jgi:hypothetical protein
MQIIDRYISLVQQELSGARALDTVWAVARHNRIVGSTDYAAAVQQLHDQLAGYGLDSVSVESFPIDGVIKYAGHVFGPAWEPHSARLEVIAPEPYLVADFAVTPMCLPSGCPATGPEGVTAEVVDLGAGDQPVHYAQVDVRGKAVLASGLTTDVYNLAVEQYGAACVMTTNMYDWSNLPAVKRTMIDLPDATHLARLYYDAEKKRPAPVFSISYRQAERLRSLTSRGPVTIRATVDAENKPGELLEVIATIQGADLADQEVWVMAHLCHPKPGACDNASGVALGVELFRTIMALIRTGKLARPRRTLRLLLLPEVSGTQAYMDRYQARMERVVAAINLDMVGASYAASGAYCRLVQTPWSRPSFINHLAGYVLEKVSLGSRSHIRSALVRNWLYSLAPYDKGSDHDVTLNSIFAIPSVFFFYWPYRFYHTDLDTPEKLDPLEFERTGAVAGALALVIADPNPPLAAVLLNLVATAAIRAVMQQVAENAPTVNGHNADRLWALHHCEQGALQSVLQTLPPDEQAPLAPLLARRQHELDRLIDSEALTPHASESPVDGWTPQRREPWLLNWGQIERMVPGAKERRQTWRKTIVDFDDKAIAALNYVNGSRPISQIARLVSGELGAFSGVDAVELFRLLAEAGVVTW